MCLPLCFTSAPGYVLLYILFMLGVCGEEGEYFYDWVLNNHIFSPGLCVVLLIYVTAVFI